MNSNEEMVLSVFKRTVHKDWRDKVALESQFQTELGIDSLKMIVILLQLEDALGITIAEQDVDLGKLRTIKDVAEFTARLSLMATE